MFQALRMNPARQSDDPMESFSIKHLPGAVAPYHKDPSTALAQCFDRYNGKSMTEDQLKTYAQTLAQYHLHPEDKFHHADYLDHGKVQRRHILVVAIEHIGKEANRWEEQLYLGENPEAQIEYGIAPENKELLRGSALVRCRPFGPGKLAKEAGLSVSDVSAILAGKRNPKVETWLKLLRAAQTFEDKQQRVGQNNAVLLEIIREKCNLLSVRRIANTTGIDPANLSHVLSGKHNLTASMRVKLVMPIAGINPSNNTI